MIRAAADADEELRRLAGRWPCAWSARPTQSWATILSGATGVGPGTVTLSVAANPLTTSRIAGIEVADRTHVVLTQESSAARRLAVHR